MESLKRYCEKYEEDFEMCVQFLGTLIKTGWKEKEAIEHIKNLIVEGVFDEIRDLLGGKKNG